MGLFEQFPYTNFHEMNLDWLLKIVKEIAGKVDSLETDIDHAIIDAINNGEFDSIIDQILFNEKLSVYDTFADIPTTGLASGDLVMTRGFYAKGDGGEALYQVESGYYPSNGAYDFRVVGDFVRARQCGIFGDGLTDNAAELTSLMTTYYHIDLEGGTYAVTTPIPIRSYRIIEGNNAIITTPVGSSNSMFGNSGQTDITIRNIQFIGCTNPGGTYYAVTLTGCTGITIEKCSFAAGYGYMVRLSGSTNCAVKDCSFSNIDGIAGNPGGCIYAQGGSNFMFEDLRASNIQDHVIYLDGSVSVDNVNANKIFMDTIVNPLTNAAMIACYGDVTQGLFTNCEAKNGVIGYQVADRSGYAPKLLTFIRCSAYNMTQEGFFISGIPGSPQDQYINVTDCRVDTSDQDAMSIRSANFVQVRGLQCNNYTRYGVALSEAGYCFIEDSRFDTGDTAIIAGYPNQADNNTFMNCVTSNNTSYGIYNRLGTNRYINCRTSTDIREIGTGVDFLGGQARSMIYRSSDPSGSATYHTAGDICIDTTGATNGWRCTASGTPGTWVAI